MSLKSPSNLDEAEEVAQPVVCLPCVTIRPSCRLDTIESHLGRKFQRGTGQIRFSVCVPVGTGYAKGSGKHTHCGQHHSLPRSIINCMCKSGDLVLSTSSCFESSEIMGCNLGLRAGGTFSPLSCFSQVIKSYQP